MTTHYDAAPYSIGLIEFRFLISKGTRMKGLEIARAYFEEYARPMLEEKFPDWLPFLAAGLTGSGSECFGYDDEISRDHDFEPGFCLFLPGEDVVDRRTAFLMERAYAALPREYMGLKRSLMQPVGGPRKGVLRTAEFFHARTGTDEEELTWQQWLSIPEGRSISIITEK